MPLPTSITDLSQTASANFPNGAVDGPEALDDVQRAHASFIALLRDGKGMAAPVTLASATTTDIGAQNSIFVEVSGTTTITSFGATYSGERIIRFTGALTLTHNATTLILPGGANITTAAGDALCAVPTQAGTGWAVVFYQRANGQALVTGGESAAIQANAYIAATASGTNTYTITPSPAITAYAAGQEFLVTFTNGNTSTATLQVSGLASPPAIVKQDSTGAYVALVSGDIPASHRSRMRMLSTTQVQLVDTVPVYGAAASITYTSQQVPFSGTLTDGATINWNADTNGQIVAVTLGGNRNMAAPTNIRQYALYIMRVSQDATGSRTPTWNAAYKFGSAGAPTLTTTANKVDFLSFIGGAGNTLEYLGSRLNAV